MITIEDNDLPITVAQKIVTATKPQDATIAQKALAKAILGKESDTLEVDLFSVEEIKEIADYLIVYCNSHLEGD